MLNTIWAVMILIGVIVAAFNGNMSAVTNGCLESATDAIAVCIKMAGIVSMWSGFMRVAEKSGLVNALSRRMFPFLSFMFPRLEKGSKAMDYIATNFIANVLGLGWAATPAGISAMKELQMINPDKKIASREMCTFMIINMSSLQLITMNILAYRSQYGSANPSEIIGPGLLATAVSSVVAIISAKLLEFASYRKEEIEKEANASRDVSYHKRKLNNI